MVTLYNDDAAKIASKLIMLEGIIQDDADSTDNIMLQTKLRKNIIEIRELRQLLTPQQ